MRIVEVDGLRVELVRKNIRTLRLTVYPPDGRVRIAAPLRVSDEAIREMVVTRRAWIRKHQEKFETQAPVVALQYSSGETHFYQGRPYHLRVQVGAPRVVASHEELRLDLYAPEESTVELRQKTLTAWYRARLKEQLPGLLAQWEPIVGAKAEAWRVKQMRTRWGTCNIRAKRIWLNVELMKYPAHCLEYVVVHELVHLHERLHNARFWGLMDQFMPEWRQAKEGLKNGTLAL